MVGGKKFTVLGYKKSVYEDQSTHQKTVTNKVFISVKLDDTSGKDVLGVEVGVVYAPDEIYNYIADYDPGAEFTGVVTRKKGQIMEIGCIFDD